MDDNCNNPIILYKATISAYKFLLKNQLITAEEYADFETKTAQKYGLNLSVIFRDILPD